MEEYFVDQLFGHDENDGLTLKESLKTLTCAINISLGDSLINIAPGTYEKIRINSLLKETKFKILGKPNSNIQSFYLNGIFHFSFEKLKIHNLILNLYDSSIFFKDVTFHGFKNIKIGKPPKDISKDKDREEKIENFYFTDCIFNQSFQIIIENCNCSIFIESCIFKGTLPLFICNSGNININVKNCTLDNSLCYNLNSIVKITTENVVTTKPLTTGKRCELEKSEIIKEKDVDIAESLSTYFEDSITKAIIVDSAIFDFIELKSNTEFIQVTGNKKFTIYLPLYPYNGDVVEILSSTVIIISGVEYYNKLFKARFVSNQWIFY